MNVLLSSKQLADLIEKVVKRKPTDKIHPATRIFQALRIAVNDELNSLKEAPPQALEILEPNGKIIVITFHSLEDKIIKDFCHSELESESAINLTPEPIRPSEDEIYDNPRSRSAKLKALEKK